MKWKFASFSLVIVLELFWVMMDVQLLATAKKKTHKKVIFMRAENSIYQNDQQQSSHRILNIIYLLLYNNKLKSLEYPQIMHLLKFQFSIFTLQKSIYTNNFPPTGWFGLKEMGCRSTINDFIFYSIAALFWAKESARKSCNVKHCWTKLCKLPYN